MPSGKIELKKGELTVDAQNVLATARPEKLIAISPFQIRTHIDLKSLDLQSPDQLKVLKAVGDEGEEIHQGSGRRGAEARHGPEGPREKGCRG